MKEDHQIATGRSISVADVVELELIAEGVEMVFEGRQRRFGKVPEAVFLCCIKISVSWPPGNFSMGGGSDAPIAY